MDTPNPLYLIEAKTKEAADALVGEGAVLFGSNVFLWDHDEFQLLRVGKVAAVDQITVLPIFTPDKPATVPTTHPEAARLRELLSALHEVFFEWSKRFGADR
jgi:hypothetical protein